MFVCVHAFVWTGIAAQMASEAMQAGSSGNMHLGEAVSRVVAALKN
jgi:hypothetical protein